MLSLRKSLIIKNHLIRHCSAHHLVGDAALFLVAVVAHFLALWLPKALPRPRPHAAPPLQAATLLRLTAEGSVGLSLDIADGIPGIGVGKSIVGLAFDIAQSEIRNGAQILTQSERLNLLGFTYSSGAHGLAQSEGLVCVLHATESTLGLGYGIANVKPSPIEYLRITCSVQTQSEEQDDDCESLRRNMS